VRAAGRQQWRWLFAGGLGLALVLCVASPAQGQGTTFGVDEFDQVQINQDGSPATQAGSHPFAMTSAITYTDPPPGQSALFPKDLVVRPPAGQLIDPYAVPYCPYDDFIVLVGFSKNKCAARSALGTVGVTGLGTIPLFNLSPPPGVLARFGFVAVMFSVVMTVRVDPNAPDRLIVEIENITQADRVVGTQVTLWGDPTSPLHDQERSHCVFEGGTCPTDVSGPPLLTLPRSCSGPLLTSYATDSWDFPGARLANGDPELADPNWLSGTVESHDDSTPPNPLGLGNCGRLAFDPKIVAKPTTLAARSPTGLDFSIEVEDEGLTNPDGFAGADIDKAVVTLPEGFSINPSVADGLEACSPAQLQRETAFSAPGDGCPNASKIGTVSAHLAAPPADVKGSLFLATPYENPFGSLIALYVVLRNPTLGIVVKQPLRVRTDPVTGQLTTTAEAMPQLPFSDFQLHFREGARSPLASPPSCGSYEAKALLYPSTGSAPVSVASAFPIVSGPESKACPTAGLPPFRPGLIAGTLNNAAGHFSPFNLRISRTDSEQEITHFSIKLPPGIAAKLATVPYCSEAQIARARSRSQARGGGALEQRNPSCPAQSLIGRTLAGFGVGSAQAYAPGKLYLAGPYRGSSLSMVSITAAQIGPFDLGTVVVREALQIDPETAEVFIDSTGSDPIPHIIDGIPVHLRDLRAYVDRPGFVLNPTSCRRTSTASTLLGSGLDFGSAADDRPVTVSTPFQAADCAALGFKPELSLRLLGKTGRGAHPKLRVSLRMKGGEANVEAAQITLPRSAFLEQGHIKTICTRAQFKAGQCPTASIYGHATAKTPLLDQPLSGPVYLRSSEHKLPDLVAELNNAQATIDLSGRIDSLNGRIRTTFEATPDVAVESFTLTMRGAGKGLLVNSTNLCRGTHRAIVQLSAHNGRVSNARPKLRASCTTRHSKRKGNRR
jgi:hypothetical protein